MYIYYIIYLREITNRKEKNDDYERSRRFDHDNNYIKEILYG